MNDADRTPRPSAARPQRDHFYYSPSTALNHPYHQRYNTGNEPLTRASFDDVRGDRSSPEDTYTNTSVPSSPSMSRSSSKASSIDHPVPATGGKPPKPRRPTNYAERTSSMSLKRASLPAPSQQPKYLNLNPSNCAMKESGARKEEGLSTPTKGLRSPGSAASTPKMVAFTPVVERAGESAQEGDVQGKESNASLSPADSPGNERAEKVETPYFPLPAPTRPAVEAVRTPATRMYWHQPPTHGMMSTAPFRRSHSIAQVGSSIFLFGGSDGGPTKATDNVFIFDTDTSFWRIPKVSGTIPPPLRAHTTTAHRHKIYLFGGGTGNEAYYNHVYSFSALTYRWTCLIPSSDPSDPLNNIQYPIPRRAHTSALHDSALYIFGGGSGTSGLNDLWKLDISSGRAPEWTQLFPTGRKPEPRVYHTATVVRDIMIIYGGLDGKKHSFSNMFLYNFSANTFTELIIPAGPRLVRIAHTTTVVGSQLFVFGGSDGRGFNNEVWTFDLLGKTWAVRGCAGTPPARRGYHTAAFYDGRLWVFGGMDTVREGFSDINALEFGGSGYLGSVYVEHIR